MVTVCFVFSCRGLTHDEINVTAFRSSYGRLSELRSLLPSSVPMVALTATATFDVRVEITTSLGMMDAAFIIESPEKTNIRYSVVKMKERDPAIQFSWLIKELQTKEHETERVIIFCGSHRQCRELHRTFSADVKDTSLFGMYHATTDIDTKKAIVSSFTEEKGRIRVLFASVAFGMGVNTRDVNTIIHYSVPMSTAAYFQESGRAGRDGSQSHAILLKHPGCRIGGRTISESMKVYIDSSDKCRRKILLEAFESHPKGIIRHLCCDVCAKSCECASCKSGDRYQGFAERCLVSIARQYCRSPKLLVVRNVSGSVKEELNHELIKFRETLLCGEASAAMFTGDDLACGFPQGAIDLIVNDCDKIRNKDDLEVHYAILNKAHVDKIWDIFTRVVLPSSTHDLEEHFAELTVDSESSSDDSSVYDKGEALSDDDIVRGEICLSSESGSWETCSVESYSGESDFSSSN